VDSNHHEPFAYETLDRIRGVEVCPIATKWAVFVVASGGIWRIWTGVFLKTFSRRSPSITKDDAKVKLGTRE
jgi:hypothetical protein